MSELEQVREIITAVCKAFDKVCDSTEAEYIHDRVILTLNLDCKLDPVQHETIGEVSKGFHCVLDLPFHAILDKENTSLATYTMVTLIAERLILDLTVDEYFIESGGNQEDRERLVKDLRVILEEARK